MKEFISSLNLQNLWENIPEQIAIWVDIVTSTLSVLLNPIYQNALVNPLPTGALLLALIGIPLIFLKIKKSKSGTEADDRLDQLMEEMESFEIKTPMVDSQENFPDSPIASMEPLQGENAFNFDFTSDQRLPDSDHINETLEPGTMIELPSLISTEESSENETSNRPEEQETTSIPLSEDSTESQFQLDDQGFEIEGMTEQVPDWSQISRPTLHDHNDTELTIEAIESLQQEMEESRLEAILDIPSEQEQKEDLFREITEDSASPLPETVEPTSQVETIEETVSTNEEEIHYQEEDSYLQPADPVVTESEVAPELSVEDEEPLRTHQETIQENFDDQVQSTLAGPEEIQEPQFSDPLDLQPILKSQLPANHTRIKPPSKNYKELLESFILLKDQKR